MGRQVTETLLLLGLYYFYFYFFQVTLIEAICFPLLYSFYIAVVVALTYLKASNVCSVFKF